MQIAELLFKCVGGAFAAYITYLMYKLNRQVETGSRRAAENVREVKQTLRENTEAGSEKLAEVKAALESTTATAARKLDGLAVVAKATHGLVNSNMAVQLRLNAALARRLAEVTRDPADADAADMADRLYCEHQAKQTAVDTLRASDADAAARDRESAPDPSSSSSSTQCPCP